MKDKIECVDHSTDTESSHLDFKILNIPNMTII